MLENTRHGRHSAETDSNDLPPRFPWLRRHLPLLCLAAVTLLALLLRRSLFSFGSSDYKYYVLPWYQQLEAGGGFPALAHPLRFCNYTLAYPTLLAPFAGAHFPALFVVKGLSTAADLALATACALILHSVLGAGRLRRLLCGAAYTAALLLPQTFVDSAFWGQCDSIYTALGLFAVYFLLQRRSLPACILLGFAFAFKLQSVFFLPLFVFAFFCDRRFRLWHWLVIPGAAAVSTVPALLSGASVRMAVQPYLSQTANNSLLAANCPNAATFLLKLPFTPLRNMLILLTLCCLAAGLALVLHTGRQLNASELLLLGTWSTLLCVCLLPCMKDRYVFPADLLLLVLAFCTRRRGDLLALAAESTVTVLSWLVFLAGQYEPIPQEVLALVRLACLGWLTYRVWQALLPADTPVPAAAPKAKP